MLEMSQLDQVEAEDILIIRDIVRYAFDKIKMRRLVTFCIFTYGFILPFYVQIVFGDYDPRIVVWCCYLCIATQAVLLVKELNNFFQREDRYEYFDP